METPSVMEQGFLKEGDTWILAADLNAGLPIGAPGARQKDRPFYNPGMALNRDLSVLLAKAYTATKGREIDIADALAGTGARSLRLAVEVPAPIIVHANDADERAVQACAAGAKNNRIPSHRLRVSGADAHAFLASQRFDIVDLDPCGSPMPFLDAAMRASRHGALVCATSTDTGALAGAFPRVCKRRYDAHHGLHAMPWRAEVGLRILAGAMVRSAARFEKVARPVLSVCSGHWMRVVCHVEDGRKDADVGLKQLAHAVADPATGTGHFVKDVPAGLPSAGPLWTGPLHDAATVEGMVHAIATTRLAAPTTMPLLATAAREAGAPAFWVVPDRLQKRLGPPPRRDALIEALRETGFRAERTHMDPQGVRTDAPAAALEACWQG